MKIFDRWRRSVGATLDPNKKRSSMGWGKRILVIGVFGSICLVFVFLDIGPGQFANFGMGGGAAQVNSKIISIRDYREYLQRLEDRQGSSISPEQRTQLRRRALEDLVNLELLSQRAQKVGLVASPEAVGARIYAIPAFQQEGRFRRNLYDMYLKTMRIRTKDFEAKVAGELNISNLQSIMTKSLYEPDMLRDLQKQRGAVYIQLQVLKFGIDDVVAKLEESKAPEGANENKAAANEATDTPQQPEPELQQAARQKQFKSLIDELKVQLASDEGAVKAAQNFARQHKLKWKQEREFNLGTPFLPPNLDEDILLSLLKNNKPVLKQTGSQAFVFNIEKSFTKTSDNQLAFDFLALRSGGEIFEAWLEAEKQKATITYNQKLLN